MISRFMKFESCNKFVLKSLCSVMLCTRYYTPYQWQWVLYTISVAMGIIYHISGNGIIVIQLENIAEAYTCFTPLQHTGCSALRDPVTKQPLFGDGCRGVCSCQNGGVCDPVFGSCSCTGFKGENCTEGA